MGDRKGHDIGKNMGQGLAGVNDNQRRDLLQRGGDQRTEDQRAVPSSNMEGAQDEHEEDD